MSERVVEALKRALAILESPYIEGGPTGVDVADALPIAKAQEAVIEAVRAEGHFMFGAAHCSLCATLAALDELEA